MESDLITTEGRKQTLEIFGKYVRGYLPDRGLFKKAFDWLFPPDPMEVIAELIKSGRDNGVDQMKITNCQTTGFDIGAKTGGIPAKAMFGKRRETTVEVKYKNN
jgi:hypothetical protein